MALLSCHSYRVMIKELCRKCLFSIMGWHEVKTVELPSKYIICMAPHTSNWDFIIGLLYSRATGMKSQFFMKKEWFFWPLGILFKRLGGVPVYRNRHTSMTDRMAAIAIESDIFALCITPEGTRSLNPEWKHGFYYIAVKANLPIVLFALDYSKKEVNCTRIVIPSGDIESDMRTIKLHFSGFKGKYPEKFSVGKID